MEQLPVPATGYGRGLKAVAPRHGPKMPIFASGACLQKHMAHCDSVDTLPVIETSDRPDNRVLPGGEYASPNREPSLRSCVCLVERTDLGVRRRSAIRPGLPGPLHAPTQTRFPLVGGCPGSSRWPRRLQTFFARHRSIASPHERIVRTAFSVNSASMAPLLELLVFPSSSKQVKPRIQFLPRPAAYPFRVTLSALADNQ